MAIPTQATDTTGLMDTVRLVERFGELVEAEKTMLVTVVTSTSPYLSTDLPWYGLPYDADTHPNVKLEERHASAVSTDGTNDRYAVNLIYRLQRPQSHALVPIRGSMSLQQIRTSTDFLGTEIKLKHGARDQVAEVAVPLEGQRFSTEFTLETNTPYDVVRKYGNAINTTPIFGEEKHKWRIANIDYERVLFNTEVGGKHVYLFTLEFELNKTEDGWFYPAEYIDPNGIKPVGLEQADMPGTYEKGRVLVDWHPQQNFNSLPTDNFAPSP